MTDGKKVNSVHVGCVSYFPPRLIKKKKPPRFSLFGFIFHFMVYHAYVDMLHVCTYIQIHEENEPELGMQSYYALYCIHTTKQRLPLVI